MKEKMGRGKYIEYLWGELIAFREKVGKGEAFLDLETLGATEQEARDLSLGKRFLNPQWAMLYPRLRFVKVKVEEVEAAVEEGD